MNLSTKIEQLQGIGPKYQKKLKRLGIKTIRNLLYHFPHRYEDFSNVTEISKIKGIENYCIQGKILEIKSLRTWKKRMFITEALVQDKTGAVKAVWFNQPYLTKTLKKGDLISLTGKTAAGREGIFLSNPSYEKMSSSLTHTGRIVPIYQETYGVSSKMLRYAIKSVLAKVSLKDSLPERIRKENNLLPVQKALWQIHFPDSFEETKRAKERFSFEELFLIELFILRERMRINKEKAFPFFMDLNLVKKLVKSLPFKLTDAQRKSIWQILKDLEKNRPMNRLLEGDVGSGKTVVAATAAINVIKQKCQVAFMAPTEILAKQHFKTINELLKSFHLNIGLLTGKEDKYISKKLRNDPIEVSRKKLLEKTEQGEINILIGTHALIQDKVKFGNLALVVLDEQHRFGVEQRAKLCKNKNGQVKNIPHLLSMTATPIPRTLALTIYGDLDISLIDELPKGRKKVITKVITQEERKNSYSFIRKEVKKGRQIFVICPRIEQSQKEKKDALGWSEVKAVKEEYEKLSKEIFPDLKVGQLHGKMAGKEKERTMKDFKNKKIDILVSTSVVEVGVDIPNATVMMIEGAERFGLSQLHQFRGRVGRSKYQSYCFLFADSATQKTKQRLRALTTCENGFELAEKDLKIRGPGVFSGTRQWGMPDIVMDSLMDMALVEKTKQTAKELLEKDPSLKEYPQLQERLKEFREMTHFE
ncbi:MAG: ATP-dependent DNA helicase RecG [Candidatus Nealsonbacteria bacterium]